MSAARTHPPTLKRLGQHFLADERIVDRIADALEIGDQDTVVEIGPGRGVLTDRLVTRAKRVVAIELDRALAELLRDRYAAQPHVSIVQADVLGVRLGDLAEGPYLLAGNVPYYITTPILFHALEAPMPQRAVFLVQREVAERAVAVPGNKIYGALSVTLQAIASVEVLFEVPPGAFRPPPNVDSAVMRVTPRTVPLVGEADRDKFQRFVQGAFGLRRKQMVRVLRTLVGLTPTDANAILVAQAIEPAARPETLSPETFVALFQAVRERER